MKHYCLNNMNKINPKVSVIIPTYRPTSYILEAIESILNQSFKDFEIIVVYDGVPEESKNILSAYLNNKQIRYVSQSRQGPNPARNKGISIAQGEYLCFLDDDDVFLPNCLFKKVDFLDKHQETGMVLSDFYLHFDDNSIKTPRLKSLKFLNFFSDSLDQLKDGNYVFNNIFNLKYWAYKYNAFHPSQIMARKEIVQKIGGFKKDYPIYGDAVFCLDGIKGCRTGFIDEGLSIYYKSRSRTMVRPEIYINVINSEINYLKNELKETQCNFIERKKAINIIKNRISIDYLEIGKCYSKNYESNRARSSIFDALKFNKFGLINYYFLGFTYFPVFVQRIIRKLNTSYYLL